ncbi:DUF302 domain-containing protein [Antarctobacter heliothermus]|uniref:DUF302 domain-containing protein n=1 Tax=Antarctobacter heliothermus TaxID=74033 RepID=A0A239B7I8_9RHOB|nr:DUF302 domain-containing protein [Antarctobacter heliothermus]SNS03113.1 protein of unknown function DUF302 [Antarctobacter heliothermus]
MRKMMTAAAVVLAGLPAMVMGETLKVKADAPVPQVMDALQAAVEGAGATVFARVDHAGGAMSVDMDLAPAQLLIFGNPKLGTPAMQDDIEAGLLLPLRVLVYSDADGQTWLAYADPAELTALEGIAEDAPYIAMMQGALKKLTGAAAGM